MMRLVGVGGINRPRSGYASPTAHNLKRCSRRAARYAPYMRSCETRCARTSSPSNSYYVCISLGGVDCIHIHPLYPSRRVYWFGLETHRKPIASNPPPRDLKVSDPTVRDLTLGELGLAPSSILHFRFVDDGLNRAFLVFFFILSVLLGSSSSR
jgi:hypothetical protein